ncbi:uncharacterized protein B4U79_10715 [Dinothrombium tinctorium]|uniref:Uncharacterized protein n=1 Tax=Dinothrombium tinctorium TaxID=1965070 RepID=A0A3S3NPH1_9ACAR|nr:uncharacterized protein B4U79_10715 [Dinothrombium tinctorium]
MNNPYINYYQNQIGHRTPGFRGIRRQRGYEWLSNLFSKAIMPLFKTIKNVDASKGLKVLQDISKAPGSEVRKTIVDDIAKIRATAADRYPITRTEIKAMTIPSNLSNVFLAYLGDYNYNPYNFKQFKVGYIACYVNGVQYPNLAYQPDFENNLCAKEYLDFINVANKLDSINTLPISIKNFNEFSFLNDGDRVKCHYCKGVIYKWEPGDKPLEEHKRYFPCCSYQKLLGCNGETTS